MPEKSSGIPPVPEDTRESSRGVTAHQESAFRVDQEITRKAGEGQATLDTESVSAWEGLEERLTAPQIRRVEVPLRPPHPPPRHAGNEIQAKTAVGRQTDASIKSPPTHSLPEEWEEVEF
jgi:hypothetical protein